MVLWKAAVFRMPPFHQPSYDPPDLAVAPGLPSGWNEFAMRYGYRETLYHISVSRNGGTGEGNAEEITVAVDGIAQASNVVLLADDRLDHRVEVRVAAERPAPASVST